MPRSSAIAATAPAQAGVRIEIDALSNSILLLAPVRPRRTEMTIRAVKREITGKTPLDVEIEYSEWLRRNEGKVRVVLKHPIAPNGRSMVVEYVIVRPFRKWRSTAR
jgi:hypothetical protein